MPYSKIVITQDSVSGAPGVSRDDILLYAVGSDEVVLTNDPDGDIGVRTWAWSILERPPGSSATLTGAATEEASFEPDVYGRYVIGLSVNGQGDGSSGYSRAVVGCRPTTLGNDVDAEAVLDWLPPAATEEFLANWGSNAYGAQPEIELMMRQLRTRFLPMREYQGLPNILKIPVPLTRTVSTTSGSFQVAGYLAKIDLSDFPWAKDAAFFFSLANTGGSDEAIVQLYDVTNAVQVAQGSTTDDIDGTVQLTIGSAAGNLRDDADTRYRVDIKSDPGGGTDTAEIYDAAILLSLVDAFGGAA